MTAVQPDAPTLGSAMLRPRSIGMLLVALAVAALFAGLGQWQLQRATATGTVVHRTTETVVPLQRVATPQTEQRSASVGQSVRTSGSWVAGDFLVVADRLNRGREGYWVTGHAVTGDPAGAQLAVALGWAPDRGAADAAVAALNRSAPTAGVLTGRYIDSDVPADTGTPGDEGSSVGARVGATPTVMAVPQLLNLWRGDTGGPVYNGYLTLRAAPAGLTDIDSPPPSQQVELNLLNLFYAAEWALFALVAFYVWYRLVRDRWELELTAEDEEPESEPEPELAALQPDGAQPDAQQQRRQDQARSPV
ncbi:SURF1 family cytochrome oxidase biogenesis protein [uncultured Amnibacterium sp.]|uniref:SURF1 family cytochrome oxidase biogenesis protein n=1 Tax=uncultured Amnibacterium sp. TaxID=1631851 RepID=UPI0035CA20E1